MDAFSLVFSSDYKGGGCRINEEQLRRVTGNHVHAFFEGQDNFLNLTLTPRLLIELSFACQDETEIRFDASVTYSVVSRGTPSQIRRDLLSYLHQTRNSFAAFLRELGWEDLDRVSVKSYDDIENVVGIPNAQKSSGNGVDQSLFLLISIAAPCFVLIAIVLIVMVCRQRGCCGGNVQRQQQEEERCEKKTRAQLEAEIYGAAIPKQNNGNNKSTRVSSSVETLSGTSDEENSVPLNQEQKSRGNNLIESTVTVATNDVSSVSLSRILASDYPRSGSSSLASEGGTDDDHDNDKTNRGRSSTKNSAGKKKRETALSPKSECRGTIKAPTIYRHLETKTSTTPERKSAIRKDVRQTKTPPKSAFELFVESTKEFKENEMETRSHDSSSYVPKFMMSFGSALSVASGDETSVCSKSVTSSRNKNVCDREGEKTESVANEQLKMVSATKVDTSARYRGTSQSPRRNVSNCPETKPDGHSSVDPVFSASQGKPLAVPPCRRDNGEIASVIDSVDENATDYSPPERTYFFGA